MKALLLPALAAIITSSLGISAAFGKAHHTVPSPQAAEESYPSPKRVALDEANAIVAKIKLGMTRAEVEKILGPDWKPGISLGWASGQDAIYSNEKISDAEMLIKYDWTGNHGIGRKPQPVDPVIGLPVLRPIDRVPARSEKP